MLSIKGFHGLAGLTAEGPLRINRREIPAISAGFTDISISPRPDDFPGECPERQRGRTVNPLAMPSQVRVLPPPPAFAPSAARQASPRHLARCGSPSKTIRMRGCSSMVEQQPSKLKTRVRFPSPAPILSRFCWDAVGSLVGNPASRFVPLNAPAPRPLPKFQSRR